VSPDDEKDDGKKSRGGLRGFLRSGLTATLTFITAALGVVFLLVPSWRPLSRDNIAASLEIPTVDSGVTILRWAQRQYPGHALEELHKLLPPDDFEGALRTIGSVVYVRLHTDGFQHRSINLRARVYDAATNVSPQRNSTVKQAYRSTSQLSVDAPSRSSVQLLLLDDLANAPKPVFVRVEAFDDHGILAYADSPTVTDGISASPASTR
jgi:hypothetical protein